MSNESATKKQSELADRQFHITIAQATRNVAIVRELTDDFGVSRPTIRDACSRSQGRATGD